MVSVIQRTIAVSNPAIARLLQNSSVSNLPIQNFIAKDREVRQRHCFLRWQQRKDLFVKLFFHQMRLRVLHTRSLVGSA